MDIKAGGIRRAVGSYSLGGRGRARGLALAGLGLFILAAVGCGGGSSSGTDQQAAPLAQSWAVALDNSTDTCFKPGAALRLVVTATDSSGQAIADPSYTASAVPSSGIETDSQGRLIVRGEGPFELTVTYGGPQSATSTIAPQTFQLMRDGTAPVITVSSPLRGAMRQTAANDTPVDITGNVADALSPVKIVVVNGEELAVSGSNVSEPIAVTRPAAWGTNLVRVRAADACGNTADQVQSFLQSAAYLAPATTKNLAARVPNASVLRVAQAAFDDNNRADFDDMVTVAERFLQNNLTAMLNQVIATIPTQRVDVLTCTLSADPIAAASIGVGSPTLALALGSGKFTFTFTVASLRIPVTYREVCRGPLGGVISDVSATFGHTVGSFTAQVTVTPTVVDRELKPVLNVSSQVTGLSVDSSSNPVLAAAINAAASLFISEIEGGLESVVSGEIEGIGGEIATAFLTKLAEVVPIQFPAPIGKTLNIAVDWTSVGVSSAALTQELGQYIFPSAVGTPYGAGRGAISRGVATRTLDGLPGPLTYGENDDGVNQMLWALWYGGGLELQNLQTYAAGLSGIGVDLTGVTLNISGLMPPVIMPAGDPGQVMLGLGDVRVTGSVDLDQNAALDGTGVVSFDAYVTLLTDGRTGFDIARNTLNLHLGDLGSLFYFQVNVLELNGIPVTGTEQTRAIKAYLQRVVRVVLQDLAQEIGAGVQLPQFRIDFPAQFFGPNAGFILDIVSLRRDQDRFIAGVDPDDAFAPTVLVGNWSQLADAATQSARQEAAGWLQGAQPGCRIAGSIASGPALRRDSYEVSDGVKRALLDAGAPEPVARDWNRVFKSAWLGWGDALSIPDLPWFPAFAGSDFLSGIPHNSAAATGPLGSLESIGRDAMTRASLKQELEFRLQDYLNQPGASAAIDAFATEISSRFDAQLQSGTIDGVAGVAVYPDFAAVLVGFVVLAGVTIATEGESLGDLIEFVQDIWPPPPPRGPLIGACQSGGSFNASAFQ